MVVLTGIVVLFLNSAKDKTLAPETFVAGVTAGATAGTVVGILKSITSENEGTALGIYKAAAAGGSSGAMYGAYKCAGAGSAGAFFGAVSAAAVTSISLAGNKSSFPDNPDNLPFTSIILGAEENPFNRETQSLGVYTYDCWKAVLHDDSPGPSNGKMLRDVLCDPRIKQVTVTVDNDSDLPRLVLDNVWNEKFLIEYLYLSNTKLAAHAVKI